MEFTSGPKLAIAEILHSVKFSDSSLKGRKEQGPADAVAALQNHTRPAKVSYSHPYAP